MTIPCPTCRGLGKIPKPTPSGTVMGYAGPDGENWPTEFCRTCGSTGWVWDDSSPVQFVYVTSAPASPPPCEKCGGTGLQGPTILLLTVSGYAEISPPGNILVS